MPNIIKAPILLKKKKEEKKILKHVKPKPINNQS